VETQIIKRIEKLFGATFLWRYNEELGLLTPALFTKFYVVIDGF